MFQVLKHVLSCLVLLACFTPAIQAQELNFKITVNHKQVEGTEDAVFTELETALTEFLNTRQWTNLAFRTHERITGTMLITVTEYRPADNHFTCSMQIFCQRPVFDSAYTTTYYGMNDKSFDFTYRQFDKLEFRSESIDNNLTALMAYYAYLAIGMHMDTMSPLGGTAALHAAESIVTNAQNLGEKGWSSFDDRSNRFAILDDYISPSFEPLRRMQYTYYRQGLDQMTLGVDSARAHIAQSLESLKTVYEGKPMSMVPQIFTEFKKDELVNIFAKKGTPKEREAVYKILFAINPSLDDSWEKIKK